MNKKHFASLESADEGGFDAGAEVMFDHTDAVDGYEYAYEQMIDGRAAENCVDAIDGAETDIASLESLISAIDEARDVGMESRSGQFALIQVGDVQKRYGINGLETAMPAMECFQGRQARMAASVSMESVKETLQKVWEWIKEQFYKFIMMIRRFYNHLTKNLNLVIEDSEKLKNVVRRMKFEGGQEIDLGSQGAKITIEGKIPTDFTSVLNRVGSANRIPESAFDKIRQDVEAALTTHKEEDKFGAASFTQEVPIPADFQLAQDASPFSFGAEALKIYSSHLLPGDRFIAVGVFGPNNAPKSYDFRAHGYVHGRVITQNVSVDKDTKTKALNSQDVFTLCQRITKTAAALKTSRGEMDEHFKKTQSTIDSILRKHQSGDGVAAETQRKIAMWYYRNNAVYAGNLHRHIEGVGYEICVGFLALAKKSVAANQQPKAA